VVHVESLQCVELAGVGGSSTAPKAVRSMTGSVDTGNVARGSYKISSIISRSLVCNL
jgi:hypothetical protein